jgi:hypothetical protein
MKKIILSIYVFLMVGASLVAQPQLNISGVIKDEKGFALPGATVFLTGTKSITSCNSAGVYQLTNVTTGNYVLVVKMIGYNTYSTPIVLQTKPLSLSVKLEPSATLLNEVKIRPVYDREKHLALFKKEFLGQTENVKSCKIVNPEVLYFTYDKKEKLLTAVADEFLIVENRALGYRLKYLLDNFSYNENTHVSTYQGYPSFEELTGNNSDQTKWKKNRSIAYRGSIVHFIKTLFNGTSLQEGFFVYKIVNRPMMGFKPKSNQIARLENQLVLFDSLLTTIRNDAKKLTFKDCLFVVYKNEKEPDEFKDLTYSFKEASAQIPEGQSSMVYLLTDSVEIDNKGLYTPANGLFFEGYWAWEKVAELMPIEYHL